MSAANLLLMVLAAAIFVAAAACAKLYALEPGWWRLGGTLALYSVGNLVVLRVLREVGLALAMSLSAVAQLIVVNALAVLIFRERLSGPIPSCRVRGPCGRRAFDRCRSGRPLASPSRAGARGRPTKSSMESRSSTSRSIWRRPPSRRARRPPR